MKLDGKDPKKEWGLIPTVGQSHPLTPDIRTNTMEIPGMEGVWDFGSEWGVRTFTIPFAKLEYDKYTMQQKLRSFVAFLMDSYGKPRVIKLTFDYEPDKYYLVKLNERIDPDRLFFTSEFVVTFIAHKPHAKFIVPSTEISWESNVPFMNDVLWGMDKTEFKITSPMQIIKLVYSGTQSIRAGFILKGSGTNVKIASTNATMVFGNMNNTTFVVDGENFTIKKNGTENLVTTDFIELVHGDNILIVTGTNLDLIFTEKLTYQFT